MCVTDVVLRRPNRSVESKRRHAIAVVLLGVIGAEFSQEVCEDKRQGSARHRKPVEGFGFGPNQNLARLTSKDKDKIVVFAIWLIAIV